MIARACPVAAILVVAMASVAPPSLHADPLPCIEHDVLVKGGSMTPRIRDGATIKVISGGPHCAQPLTRGDVLALDVSSSPLPLIKSLRGLPGDAFGIDNDRITIDGKILTNDQGIAYHVGPAGTAMLRLYERDYHGIIPLDSYLVLGENPSGTLDSTRFGLISRDAIIGRMVEY